MAMQFLSNKKSRYWARYVLDATGQGRSGAASKFLKLLLIG